MEGEAAQKKGMGEGGKDRGSEREVEGKEEEKGSGREQMEGRKGEGGVNLREI